jgi:hypothetical protein
MAQKNKYGTAYNFPPYINPIFINQLDGFCNYLILILDFKT